MIPFNKPFILDKEMEYIIDAVDRKAICGDGYYTKKCHKWLEDGIGCKKALLTHSCTGALEMCALLLDLQPGDEVIMPSYTFVSTANAFVLRGAVPVFVDIRNDTMNIDETKIKSAITPKTKAICLVHYAGVACEMDSIMGIAKRHNLYVIEDAAQAILSKYKGRNLGTFGDFAALSFHETKNIISGEGGALLINDQEFSNRAEIIREKGTNRTAFFRGEVDKYSWVDIGSSYLPSDMIAAFLYAQLEHATQINMKRKEIWNFYHDLFGNYSDKVQLPYIPDECDCNSHMYHIVFDSVESRTDFIDYMRESGIHTVFHYIPLHSSIAGRKFGRTPSKMPVTNKISETLLRLPMFYQLTESELDHIQNIVHKYFRSS